MNPDLQRQIIADARSYVGTPFHHQQRVPGVGMDCVAIPICIAEKRRLHYEDFRAYGREADGMKLEELLAKCCKPVALDQIQAGHILLFWIQRRNFFQHVGLYTGDGRMVHAHALLTGGQVREETLAPQPGEQRTIDWTKRLISAWEMVPTW